MIKKKVSTRGANKGMTNMIYLHTCPVCRVDLIVAVVLLTSCQLVKFTRDVIGGT